MITIEPVVHKLVLGPRSADQVWKFKKPMRSEFHDNLAGRIWWVNHSINVRTSLVKDQSEKNALVTRLPPGMHVFSLQNMDHDIQEKEVVSELESLFQQEADQPTVPLYDMSPCNNLRVLFMYDDPSARQMTYSEVCRFLEQRTTHTKEVVRRLSNEIKQLLGITQQELETSCILTIIHYKPNAGLQTHIDNVARTHGTGGPVFTMSLGGSGVKCMDMLPVMEYWKDPIRVFTPVPSVIMLDGESRWEWGHSIPIDDPTDRWSIMFRFCQITDNMVKYSQKLQTPVHECALHLSSKENA